MAVNREYSPADNTLTYMGTSLVGLAPDSAVSVEWNTDITDEEVGSDGITVITILPDKSAIVTVTFQQESEGDRILSAAYEAQRVGIRLPNGSRLYKGPLMWKSSTGDTIVCVNAHMKGRDARSWGSTANGSTRAWTFYCERVRLMDANNWASIGMVLSDEIRQVGD